MMSSSSVVFRTNIICPGSSRSITNTENWLLSGTKGMGYKLSSLLQLSDNLHKNISKWTGECRLEVIFWSHLVVGQRGAIKRMMMITVDRNTLRYWEERSPPRTKYHRNNNQLRVINWRDRGLSSLSTVLFLVVSRRNCWSPDRRLWRLISRTILEYKGNLLHHY